MRGYILTLCASALFVTLSSFILPEGNIKKYALLVSSVMISLSIVSPLKNFFTEREVLSLDGIEYEEMKRDDAEKIYENAIKDQYKKSLEERFSLYGRCYVYLNDDLSVSLIEIYRESPLPKEAEEKIREEINPERIEIKYGDY